MTKGDIVKLVVPDLFDRVHGLKAGDVLILVDTNAPGFAPQGSWWRVEFPPLRGMVQFPLKDTQLEVIGHVD